MVIAVKNFVDVAQTPEQGQVLFDIMHSELQKNDVVTLSFRGISVVTSSFINSSILKIVEEVGRDSFIRRVKLQNVSPQVRDILTKSYYKALQKELS